MSRNSRRTAFRAMLPGALLMLSTIALAQGKPPKPTPAGPPVATTGSVKSNPKADKGQATAAAARMEARERKAEKAWFKAARAEPKHLMKGIDLTKEQKENIKAIEKRYDAQLNELDKADKDADKAGKSDVSIPSRVEDIRLKEREELRSALTPEQQRMFAKNVSTLGEKKG